MEDLSPFPSTASTSQKDHEINSGSTSSRKLRITLLSNEWESTTGDLSTINRELAIQLAKHPSVEVSVYLPQCSEEDKRVAVRHNVHLIEAEKMPGYDPVDWLSFLPKDHAVDCVIGHEAVLGRQVQVIKRDRPHCKWIQVVHTAPEELGMYKGYEKRISKGEEKHQVEVELCKLADQVVAVGGKVADAFSGYLRSCGKHQEVLHLTPGIFSEFSDVKQVLQELGSFSVLVLGRGDSEDFQLKGYDIAAQAIAELKDTTYKLLFVGATSGEEEKVADLLLEHGIDRSQLKVRCFDERRKKLAQLFCEVDLAIMPSRTEGFGIAALEALSAGLPVLVSANSGLGVALRTVLYGSYSVVDSEDPKDWANGIRAARQKDRKIRLHESKILSETYAKVYNWQDHCNRLVEIMHNISRENSASNEQNSSVIATVDCHPCEKPSCSEKLLQKGSSEGLQPVKKGKRALPPGGLPDPKHPRLSKGVENLDIQIACDAIEQGGASSTQNVSGKENVVDRRGPSSQEVLNLIAGDYLQAIHPQNLEELNGFLQYMQKVRQVIIVDVKTGSLIITVRCTSLRILDDLWEDYCTGHLQEVAQRNLVTEDILQQWGLDSVQLTLTISEEEYKAYRKNFLKNEGMSKPQDVNRKLLGLSPDPGTPALTAKKSGKRSPGPSSFRNTKESPLQKEVPTRQSPRKHRAEDLIGFAQPEKKRQKKDNYGTKSDQGYVQADSTSLVSDTKPQGVKREQPRIFPESSPKTLKSTEEQSRIRSPRPSTFKEPRVHKVKVPTRRSPRKPRAEDSVGSAQPAKKGQKQETSDNQRDQGAPDGKSPIEVSFALDCSLSVSEKEIQKQIAFVKDMKESLNTSLNHVKEYHLVVYGDIAETVSHDQSTRSFYDHLRELKTGKWSESQCRRMDLALTEAAKCFRSDPNEVYHLIVLMTAGKQGSDKDNEETGKGLLESVAEELFSKKIKVIVVPVGLETDFQELGSIVKRPQYLFPLSSFKDMDSDIAKKIALNIVETVDLEKYAKDAFENFQGIASPESESALWENIRVCSDVLEGAWYNLYEDNRQEKVKMLIRENIDNFLSTLVTESKVFITLAVFGPLGAGKSFFLNSLLSLGLDSCKVQNGPLPSAKRKSQTRLPIYIKYGRNVQVSLHKEETELNPTPCFYEEEIVTGTFDRVKNKIESIFKEKDAKYVELQGPFPVFKELNQRKMTRSGLHLELEVDVQFIDVPGLGDKRGDSYINVALSKADIVLFFESGKFGKEVSAEDIAQIFRRRDTFEFTSRPKLVHIFNDERPSLSPSETFDGLSKERKKDLQDAWEDLRKKCDKEDDNYKQVREKIPQLYGQLLLEKISRESEVIYFHLRNDKVLDSLKQVVNGHVQTVKRKEIIRPILQKIHWAAKKMRIGVTQRMATVKKKKKRGKVNPGEVIFEVQSDMYSDEADELIKLFAEKKRDAMLDLDSKSLEEFLFNNFMLSPEILKFLLDMLTESLVIYTNELIQDFIIRNFPLVEEGPADVLDLIELLCLSRVKNFSTNTAPAYLFHFLTSGRITLTKAETLKWKDASVQERTDLIPSYLSILLKRSEESLKKNTRDKHYKKSHFHLMKTLKEIVNAVLSARSLHDASWTVCLTSLKEKLPMIKDFCEKSIRVINPHPEMDARANLSLPPPKDMKNARENHKVPSQSSHSQIIDAMAKILCGTKRKDIIREMETKLKITGKDHGYLEPQEPKQVDQLLWGKALITALSDKDFFNISPQSEDEKASESSIVLRTNKTQNKELVDQAKKLLFAHKKSSVSCKIVIEESRHANEIHLRKNDPETCLEVLVSSTTRQTLDDICKEFKDPSQNLAPIFIPTNRPGSTLYNQGNYFLEEDPWSRVSAEGIRAEEEVEGNQDEENMTMGKESSGITGFNQNIFLVVEKQHLITLQNTIDVLGPPKGSKIRLTYVVLPQNGRGIGVTRAIIKSLAECFKFSLYWTVDDDIQFMHHFDQNDRKWHKCSITRGLLFAQRVFQACLQKTTKELTKKDRHKLYEDATKDWPEFASDIKMEACSLLMNDMPFAEVQKNLSLLHGPFSNIPEAIRGDKEKEGALRQYEEIFVHKCKERLFEDTVNHIVGVSIAVSTRKPEYMSTYPTADYMPSEQRDKVVLNNTCALKGKNFVTDEVIFDQEEDQVTKKDKQNKAYWGLRDEEKSFNRALTVSGIINYQVIRLVRSHKKLASVHRSEEEEES